MRLGSSISLLSFVPAAVFGASEYVYASYFANWMARGGDEGCFRPESYEPGLCSHLFYAFCTIGDNYTVQPDVAGTNREDEENMYRRVVGLKKLQPSLKVLLAFGGWGISQDSSEDYPNGRGEVIREMLESRESRRIFIDSVVRLVREYNFDGFDLDYEPFPDTFPKGVDAEKNKRGLSSLVREFREVFDEEAVRDGKQKLLLTAAVYGSTYISSLVYDVKSFSESLDFVNIMTYDFAVGSKTTAMNSPLHDIGGSGLSVSSSIDFWVGRGMPEKMIVMGLPAYGRGWALESEKNSGLGSPASGPSAPISGGEPGVASYPHILGLLESGDAKRHSIDDRNGLFYLQVAGLWFTYEDPSSLRVKLRWLREKSLRGAFFWALHHDKFEGEDRFPLHRIVSEELSNPAAFSDGPNPLA